MAAKPDVTVMFSAEGQQAVGKATRQIDHDLNKVNKSVGRLNGAFRGMRGGAAQLGYQIQDVAVQLQGGTHWLQVFGQQGSQVASIMGPGGAMIGAVIAVGAALGSALVPNLMSSIDVFKDLEDNIMETAGSFGGLTEAQREWLVASRQMKALELALVIEELKAQVEAAKAEYDDAAKRQIKALQEAERQIGRNRKARQGSAEAASEEGKQAELAYKKANAALDTQNRLLGLLNEQIDQLKSDDPLGDQAEHYKNAREAADEYIASLRKQAETYGMSSTELMRYEASLLSLTETERQSAEEYIQFIEDKIKAEKALNAEKKVREQLDKNLAKVNESLMSPMEKMVSAAWEQMDVLKQAYDAGIISIEEYSQKIQAVAVNLQSNIQNAILSTASSIISSTQSQMSTLSNILGEASAAGKAFFLVSQTLAAANAIINGFQAASAIRVAYAELAAMTANPAIAVAGEAHAAMAVGMGFATAGAIMGQTAASFEGGGITFNGVRSGGLDGRGGRMAVVHPNEKITDLEKGGEGGGPVNVNFNITANDAKGFDELLMQRRAMITNLVNQAINNRGRSSLA